MCRYFDAHENINLMERSKLVCTQAVMTKTEKQNSENGFC